MKKGIVLAIMAVVFASCKDGKEHPQQEPVASQAQTEVTQTANLDWLLGNWKRTNDEAGRSTFETWKKTSATQYDGIGYTLAQGDTLSKEYMKVEQVNGQWSLFVRTSDEADTVEFKVAELKENTLLCVNEAHDFPTHIAYHLDGDKLKAKVSNKDMVIDFHFVKE